MDADGTPVDRSRFLRGKYDTEPPFWFRYSGYLTMLLFLPVYFGIGYGNRPAIAVGLVLVLGLGIPVVLWERRHRVRTIKSGGPHARK